jgi:hypothetical protein
MKTKTVIIVLAVVAVIAVLAALLLPALSAAYEISYHSVRNKQLDISLEPQLSPAVVAGTIKRIIPAGTRIRAPSYLTRFRAERGFKDAIEFHVSAVVYGDEAYKDRTLELPLLRFE